MDLDPAFIRHGLIIFILLAISVVFHDWAQAMTAHLLGDDTPKADGRVSLNPLAHMDLFGTVVFPFVYIFLFGANLLVFGYGRPIRINSANFRNRRRDELLVVLSGPAMNLVLAFVAVLLGSFVVVSYPVFIELVQALVVMNVGLAVFNLLPIPPLDGGWALKIVAGMSEETYLLISRWSWLLMLLLYRIPLVQEIIGLLIGLALRPFGLLCNAINPTAYLIIFRS